MSTDLEELAVELLNLPVKSRAMLAERLLASLDEEPSPDSERLWLEEIRRRCAEIEAGEIEGVPAEQVFRELRQRFP